MGTVNEFAAAGLKVSHHARWTPGLFDRPGVAVTWMGHTLMIPELILRFLDTFDTEQARLGAPRAWRQIASAMPIIGTLDRNQLFVAQAWCVPFTDSVGPKRLRAYSLNAAGKEIVRQWRARQIRATRFVVGDAAGRSDLLNIGDAGAIEWARTAGVGDIYTLPDGTKIVASQ